jgi:hypothetical protein
VCTVTVIWAAGTVRLACNRDEQLARPPALPPQIRRAGGRRAAFPTDPAGGGTWVAVSDAGLAMVLLNVNEGEKQERLPPRSRGAIIPALLPAENLATAARQALALEPAGYAPFRLVLVDRRELAEVRSDGKSLRLLRRAGLGEPALFTSSGLGDALVEGPRRRLFEEVFARAGSPFAQQDAYHRHSWPDRPHLSVCMNRPGARTVSRTVVTLAPGRASLAYHPDAPDRHGGLFLVSLPLPPGGAR